ncbi:NAD(P)H-dependent oxidoreductase subunit E [Methylophilaceae bacterium]|jgi:NADH-quinone oxidoreductase subunit E|nr:NAD(P)H-dependent oxidoreductase subunit E [Nitrosomonadales bacterium]MCH9771115.1 NAD(P)H-dependent oxidoreductase subunit E [Betaproteobacteria bacterium]MDC1109570.1 NAD(P)H-dependent oxidoreductase subunit E [Methylophilaceae bacterium]
MLTKITIQKIDKELKKFPDDQKQSAIIAALQIIQTENGFLTNDLIAMAADYLDMPKIAAMEVATFYNMFELKPAGKYKISICTNISCALRDADDIVCHLKKKLKIDFNEVTKDKKFSLKESECMGACGGAPLMTVNNQKMYEYLTPQKVDQILEELDS